MLHASTSILVPGRAVLGSFFPIPKCLLGDTVCYLVTPPFPPPPPSLQVVTQAQYQAHLESLGILIKAKNFLVFQVEFIILYATYMHREMRLQIRRSSGKTYLPLIW